MKTVRDYIKEIRVNRPNLENIADYGIINGSLLIDIESKMKEYSEERLKEWKEKLDFEAIIRGAEKKGSFTHKEAKALIEHVIDVLQSRISDLEKERDQLAVKVKELEEDREKQSIGFADWMMVNRWYNTSTNQDGLTLYYLNFSKNTKTVSNENLPTLDMKYKTVKTKGGNIHRYRIWTENFKDEDTGKLIPIERQRLIKVNGKKVVFIPGAKLGDPGIVSQSEMI